MAKTGQGYLRVQGGHNDGTLIPLSRGLLGHILGRSPDSFVVVSDPTVSRRHALIFQTADGFVLRDLESRNGTYVNGCKTVGINYVLRHGDRICLAGSNVEYVVQLVTDPGLVEQAA